MTGGIWLTQNKVRPGAYINFKSVPKPLTTLGTRGILTMPLALDWGATVTEIYSTDLLNGKSLAKIGYTAFDDEAQILKEALKSTYKAIIYRLDTGGVKATLTIGSLVITAKYFGICGNNIKIAIVANGDNFDVITFYNDIEQERQTVALISALVSNDFVDFDSIDSTGGDTGGNDTLEANAGAALTGGANGTVTANTAYPAYLSEISKYTFNTMGIPYDVADVKSNIVTFIKNLRDVEGIKVQAVLYDYPEADNEGIISSICGYETDDEIVSAPTFVATLAGLIAGAEINQSLTNYAILGATAIVNELDNEGIIEALNEGQIVLSKRQDGTIKIEQDINTFTSVTVDKNKDFRKNRIIRTLDEINNTVKAIWENSYEGKIDNDATGRKIYSGDVLHYLGILEGIHAIQNVDAETDVDVQAGDDSDAVIATIGAQPVDSMEKLYMQVNVR